MKCSRFQIGAALGMVATIALGQSYSIDRTTFDAGGGTGTGGVYRINSTIGQFEASFAIAEELIVNGSFENTAGTFARDGNGLMILQAGSAAVPGWTVSSGELAWGDNTNAFNVRTPFGGFLLDLTGFSGPNATIAQTITTVPGRKYRLSLSVGSHATYSGPKTVSVCAGSAASVFTLFPTNASGDQWGTFSFAFVAAGSFTEIVIHGIRGGAYLGLDNVSVVPDYSATPGSSNLVVNGSFETACPNTFVSDGNGVMSLAPGSTVIPGWTTTNAEILWGLNANAFGIRTPSGSLFMDFTGYHDNPPYGGVAQTITTSPGRNYQLSFVIGAQQDNPAYRGPMTVSVTAGSASNSFTFAPTNAGNQWGTFTMEFTAESAATPLTFTGIASTGGQYLGLDNVSVTVAPEPLRLTTVSFVGNTLRFEIPPNPIRNFVVEGRADLTTGEWLPVSNFIIQENGGIREVIIETDPAEPSQFYRVKLSP